MTALNEAKETIYAAFKLAWAAETVPYYFDNEVIENEPASFIRLVVRHSVSSQETLGQVANRKFKRTARVIAQVFTALDQGSDEADGIARKLVNIYEGKTLSPGNIWFNAVDAREIGESNGKYQINVEAGFSYEEIK